MALICSALEDVHVHDLYNTSGITFDICSSTVENNLMFVVHISEHV